MKKIIFVLLAFALSSCATTPIEKDCISKAVGEGYKSCKEYAFQETLKEYGITKGKDCLDYSAKVAKEWEGTYMIEARQFMKTAVKRQVKDALRECKIKVKERKNDCEDKVDSCIEASVVVATQ